MGRGKPRHVTKLSAAPDVTLLFEKPFVPKADERSIWGGELRHVLALALHERTGYELWILAEPPWEMNGGYLHAFVRRPDGGCLDIYGWHSLEELIAGARHAYDFHQPDFLKPHKVSAEELISEPSLMAVTPARMRAARELINCDLEARRLWRRVERPSKIV